jgi:hypothetical protein
MRYAIYLFFIFFFLFSFLYQNVKHYLSPVAQVTSLIVELADPPQEDK